MITSTKTQRLFALSISSILLAGFAPSAFAGAPNITPGQCGSMDIAFVIDTTGSMGGEIANIQTGFNQIITDAQLASQGNQLRLGLVEVTGGKPDPFVGGPSIQPDYVAVHWPLTTNVAGVQASINALTATFGGQFPEATDQGKATVLQLRAPGMYPDGTGFMGQVVSDPANAPGGFNAPFTANTKIAILVTDDAAGGFNDVADAADDALIQSLGTTAFGLGIKMSDLYSGTAANPNDAIASAQLQADAANSGGVFMQINPDGTGAASAIMSIIADCGGDGGSPVGGEFLSIDTSSLVIGGLASSAMWLAPLIAVATGTGFYFTRSLWNKPEE